MFKSNKIYLVGLSDSFQAQTHSEKHKTPLAIKVNMSGELWKLLVLRFFCIYPCGPHHPILRAQPEELIKHTEHETTMSSQVI